MSEVLKFKTRFFQSLENLYQTIGVFLLLKKVLTDI